MALWRSGWSGRPAPQFVQHRRRGHLHHLVRPHLPVVDELVDERDGNGFGQRRHLQGRDDLLDHLRGPRPGGDTAVADEAHRLVLPFPMQVVDRILQWRGEAIVVLGHDEDEGVGRVDHGAPRLGVPVRVAAQAGVVGLVHERQVELGKVHDLDVEPAVRDGALAEPLRDRQPDAAGPRAGDDDHERGHRTTYSFQG